MPRAIVDLSLTIDMADFARRGCWIPNGEMEGTSSWPCNSQHSGTIGFRATPRMLTLIYETLRWDWSPGPTQ
jgi:hypothetical protein